MGEEHICRFYRGKIKNVTFRKKDNAFYCRGCGKKLQDSEVDPMTLNKIRIRKNG